VDHLLDRLTNWKPFRALVVGDFMLDQLVYGHAERLSADAPVPILHVRKSEDRPGGAANVCLDLIALRGRVEAFGVTGADEHASRLRSALSAQGVGVAGLVADASRPTTVKQSLIGLAQARHPQKMFRVDFESREPISDEVTDKMLRAFREALPGADVVCIEDYAKGVCGQALCQGVIEASRRAGVPVFVDPARLESYARYRGATSITPNRTEAQVASGLDACEDGSPEHNARLARKLMDVVAGETVVLTLDRHGALLLEREGEAIAVPTVARQVYDVTGAGDMFLAGLAAARANGCGWEDAVRVANAAAGLEVEVFGVQPIPFEKVHHSILEQNTRSMGKVRSIEQIKVEIAARRASGQKIVFTNGCFDVIHAGHVSLLEQSAALGDFLVVGMNDDGSVRRLKGPTRPVNGQDDRARVLGSIAGVGAVVMFGREGDDTPLDLIRAVRPDTLVKGADYTKDRVVGASDVEAFGGRVVLVDLVAGRSTTGTIQKMAASAPAGKPGA
jgi:D-beta-D-heptose 7-phosphate kinase/D-beta-D-heptose 1-phosphate adenosyltransferase